MPAPPHGRVRIVAAAALLTAALLAMAPRWDHGRDTVRLRERDREWGEGEDTFSPQPRPEAATFSSTSTSTSTDDETRVQRTRRLCGRLCSSPDVLRTPEGFEEGAQLPRLESLQRFAIQEPVNCSVLFSPEAEEVLDVPATGWPPPRSIPPALEREFTLYGRARVGQWYIAGRRPSASKRRAGGARNDTWTEASFRNPHCPYGEGVRRGVIAAAKKLVQSTWAPGTAKEKHVLVLGSITPWVEMAFINAGVGQTTTVEYGRLVSSRPNTIHTLLPSEFNALYREGKLPQFDAFASFSSLEHGGLGRYGDQLNPWGDIVAMLKATCVLKPGAPAVIGVPCGPDSVVWNAHRIYGSQRFPLLLNGLTPVDMGPRMPGDDYGPHCLVTARKVEES